MAGLWNRIRRVLRSTCFVIPLTMVLGVMATSGSSAAEPREPRGPLAAYAGTIRPLLATRCTSCHGGLKQEAGLRLDTATLMKTGGESGPAVVPGVAEKSLLVSRVRDTDPATRMPPEGEGEPLTAEQIRLIETWIKAGCPAPPDEKPEADPRDHWAFQPRVRPPVPTVKHAAWVRNPIDAFLAAGHERAGVVPQPEAPRHVLVRRLYLDLIGLPPQPDELAALLADTSADWYEKIVDALLADPRHGERWGRHWMDVWRYADWWGLGDQHRYSQKHMWHFRDWIVESLNADTPYDEMVRLMLAADELHPDDPAKLRATGFLARNWFLFNRTPWMDETVEHVGKGLLGLTLNCSKCHAHKYDPIQQEDYYRFRAFFEPIETRVDVRAGEGDLEKDGIPRVFDGHLDRPTYLFVRGEDTKPDTSKRIEPGVPEVFSFRDIDIKPVQLPRASYEPERRPGILDAHVATARRAVEAAEAVVAKAVDKKTDAQASLAAAVAVAKASLEGVVRRAEATRIGWATEGDAAEDATAKRLAAARAAVRAEREIAVAKARQKVVDLDGRLAKAAPEKRAEVEKELVKARDAVAAAEKAAAEPGEAFTPLVGAKWTPTRFKSSGADDPVVPFPATSSGRRTALAHWITDPRNPLTARVAVNHLWMRHMGKPLVTTVFEFGRKGNAPTHPELLDWLASELVEGPLDGPQGGRAWSMKHLHRLICTSAVYRMGSSTKGADRAIAADPDNLLVWRREPVRLEAQVVRDGILSLAGMLDATMGGPSVPEGQQAASRRRSLYFWHSDISRNPFLCAFDDAGVVECYERDRSIVPQQALALSNAAVVHDAAARLAEQLGAAGAATDDAAFLERAFSVVLHRPPTAAEKAACLAALGKWRAVEKPAGTIDPAQVHLVWTLFNHNDFVTMR